MPVTVGIARTRTLAKLISDTAKPFGARTVLDPETEAALLAARPVTDVSGIGTRRAARLQPYGIRTCLDLARADRRLVRSLLTVAGEAVWWELNGEPVQPIRPDRPAHKMLSRGGSIGRPTADPVLLYAWLVRNLERLVEELEYHGVHTGCLTLWVGYRDGRWGTGRMTLMAPSARFDLLLEAAAPALRQAWRPGAEATRLHLIAGDLRVRGYVQLGLFEPPAERAEALARLKHAVNAQCGRFALRSGATLPLGDVYHDEANDYDICDVRGKICF